ncbi:hypothetical protein ACIQ9E_29200 [Streptomyces sp. NPDC094448]|uniref:hypothetical protein n=1 Tax=Streptomyces sp. NPDC094448 TaxID=3366063 RepID=UPI003800F495
MTSGPSPAEGIVIRGPSRARHPPYPGPGPTGLSRHPTAVQERYPRIRPGSGWTDPRIGRSGPEPGAGGEQYPEQYPERAAGLTARLVLVLTAVAGQLRGLTVVPDAWMAGRTAAAWWWGAFLCLSLFVVLGLWALGPKDR